MDDVYVYEQEELPLYVPIWKFCLLSFCSFGLYDVYYFYRGWRYLKYKEDTDIQPVWRAIFSIFFIVGLNRRFAGLANETSNTAASDGSAILFILMSLTYKLPDPFWIISMFSFLPLIVLVKNQNTFIRQDYDGFEYEVKFKWWEVLIVVLGSGLAFLIVLGLTVPEV